MIFPRTFFEKFKGDLTGKFSSGKIEKKMKLISGIWLVKKKTNQIEKGGREEKRK